MIEETIPSSLDGERLDRVVALVTGLSRSAVKPLIEQGKVTINGAVPSERVARVSTDDRVCIEYDAEAEVDETPAANASIDLVVVHEDDDVVVIDKAPGLVVHPGAGHHDDTLVNAMLARYPDLADVGDPNRPGIVHRLDRDTSGLLVVARNEDAYDDLVAQLSDRSVTRRYEAICSGRPTPSRGVVDAPIGRSRRSRTKMAISYDGKPARTHYQELAHFDDPIEASHVECHLETGRTHQIRVHLAAIGAPVMGDVTYGRPDSFGAGRVMLHAASLAFEHPSSGDVVRFDSPLPADMVAVLARLRLRSTDQG
ncbi:MAG: RluA family pseudouridine synthase [Acidimicrobiales bacterium]|nr:RluA family pseudouridine synthase [Acidimicrobiales bacterium]